MTFQVIGNNLKIKEHEKTVIIIVSIFCFTGCFEQGSCRTESQTFINKSEKDIEIFAYKSYLKPPESSNKISLKNQEKIHGENFECPPGTAYFPFVFLVKGDSIVIDYGDKIKSYSLDLLKMEGIPITQTNKINPMILFTL